MKYKEFLGEEQVKNIRQKLEECFKSEKPSFIIILNGDKKRITDSYMNICRHCVMQKVDYMTRHADLMGLMADEDNT